MNDIKCPFCQDTLIPCIKNQNDWIYHCDNQKCPMYDDADNENAKHLLASEDLWQELIRTRKALDIAVRAIETIKYSKKSDAINLRHKANKALIEIYKIKDQPALEQKGGKNERQI